MRKEIEEESSAVLQLDSVPASRLRSLYASFVQSKPNLEKISHHFRGDFQKATHFHLWSNGTPLPPPSFDQQENLTFHTANSSEATMVDENPTNPLLGSSRGYSQNQCYPTGAPYVPPQLLRAKSEPILSSRFFSTRYDSQFAYVPRRAEQQQPAKKKFGFFKSFSNTSDTSDSDGTSRYCSSFERILIRALDARAPVRPPIMWAPM